MEGEHHKITALIYSNHSSRLFPHFLNAALPPFYLCGRQATMNAPKRQITWTEHVMSHVLTIRVDDKTTARFWFSHYINPHKSVFTSNSCNNFEIPHGVLLCTVRQREMQDGMSAWVFANSHLSAKSQICLLSRSTCLFIRQIIIFIIWCSGLFRAYSLYLKITFDLCRLMLLRRRQCKYYNKS